ncbi:autotransporter outer membrane beta-barrel domain-containing protein [Piscirickettsia litoralis]|uniref:Autotransporter domain-containing protein n=1 Tax=Piscirickettsia litoralis TaxID=1891921 RepID=A0ABX3A3J2_9GAMM|nr:autotransporter outer membrane beta-barrel domain-containing protein [Piscirickettsia litoralis]ODN41995.1 hypothetical protein BGC07_02260 [Piscirickettsia litoralis]
MIRKKNFFLYYIILFISQMINVSYSACVVSQDVNSSSTVNIINTSPIPKVSTSAGDDTVCVNILSGSPTVNILGATVVGGSGKLGSPGSDVLPLTAGNTGFAGGDGIEVNIKTTNKVTFNLNTEVVGGRHGYGQITSESNHGLHFDGEAASGQRIDITANLNRRITGGSGRSGVNFVSLNGGGHGRSAIYLDEKTNNLEAVLNISADLIGGNGGNGALYKTSGISPGSGGQAGQGVYIYHADKTTLNIGYDSSAQALTLGSVLIQGGVAGLTKVLQTGTANTYQDKQVEKGAPAIFIREAGETTINISSIATVKHGNINEAGEIPNAIETSSESTLTGIGKINITNLGVIEGDINIETSTDVNNIVNNNLIIGDVKGGSGQDLLISSGIIKGVFYGSGDSGVDKSSTDGNNVILVGRSLSGNFPQGSSIYAADGGTQGASDSLKVDLEKGLVMINPGCNPSSKVSQMNKSAIFNSNGNSECNVTKTAINEFETIETLDVIDDSQTNILHLLTVNGAIKGAGQTVKMTVGKGTNIVLNEVNLDLNGNQPDYTSVTADIINKGTILLNSDIEGSIINESTGKIILNSFFNEKYQRVITNLVTTQPSYISKDNSILVTSIHSYDKANEVASAFTLTSKGGVDATGQTFHVHIKEDVKEHLNSNTKEILVLISGTAVAGVASNNAAINVPIKEVVYVDAKGGGVSQPSIGNQPIKLMSGEGTNQGIGFDNTGNVVLNVALEAEGTLVEPPKVAVTPPAVNIPATFSGSGKVFNNPDNVIDPTPPTPVTSVALPTSGQLNSRVLVNHVVEKTRQAKGQNLRIAYFEDNTSGVSTGSRSYKNKHRTQIKAKPRVKKNSIWTKVYGTRTNQQPYDDYDGYQANLGGVILALDRSKFERRGHVTSLGVAFGYNKNHSDMIENNETPSSSELTLTGRQVGLYLSQLTNRYFVVGILGYSRNQYQSNRFDSGFNELYTAEFEGDQYFLSLKGGYDLQLSQNLTLTGLASSNFDYLTYGLMQENNDGFVINAKDYKIWTLGLGAQIKYDIRSGKERIFQPELHGRVFYDDFWR